jgi:hypothetical protein
VRKRSGRAFSKRGRRACRIDGDDFEIGAGGLIRFAAALLPIAQGAERDMVVSLNALRMIFVATFVLLT